MDSYQDIILPLDTNIVDMDQSDIATKVFLNALVSNMGIGVITYDMDGEITLINNKATEFLGITLRRTSLLKTDIRSIIHIPELIDKIINSMTRKKKSFLLENLYHNDLFLNVIGKKLVDEMLLTITDISATVLAKDEATQSLILGQEMERRRLAKEIHDGIGPDMSTLKLQLDAVRKKTDNSEITSALEEISQAVSTIATDIRQVSHDLMPSSLIDYGVVTALNNFAKRISKSSDIEIQFQSNIKDGELTREYKLNIFRIVQELVNNAIKYSKCSSIEISLRKDVEGINILVQDDGIGLTEDTLQNGMGLQNIATRVNSLHGIMNIDSKQGYGTSFQIDLPVIQ